MRIARLLPCVLLLAPLLGSACKPHESSPGMVADTVAARQEVESLMTQHYAAFARGEVETWTGIMADSVYLSAADPSRPAVGRNKVRDKMVAEFGPAFAAGLTLSVQPTAHEIWVSEDGKSAASSYELNYVSTFQNRAYPVQLRSSILLSRESTGWRILAAQYSRPIGLDTLFLAVVNQRIPPAGSIAADTSGGGGEVARRFAQDLSDISLAPLAENVVVILPGGGMIKGAPAARAALVEWLGRPGNAGEAGTGLRAALAPSGTAGWVATNLKVPIYAGPESGIAPIRALVIYHRAGNQWKIVQAHFSVGLPSRN